MNADEFIKDWLTEKHTIIKQGLRNNTSFIKDHGAGILQTKS